jgi:hypothetical protein
MDWNRIEGNWKEAKGEIKQKWGQLTDDDLTQVNGRPYSSQWAPRPTGRKNPTALWPSEGYGPMPFVGSDRAA